VTVRALGQVILAVGVVLLLLGLLYSSEVATTLPGRSQALVVCDGSTRIKAEQCGPWGAALVDGERELPQGIEPEHISRLEIERALWGYVDRCTVKVYLVGASAPFEQATACR
jgi:hypothetical protein